MFKVVGRVFWIGPLEACVQTEAILSKDMLSWRAAHAFYKPEGMGVPLVMKFRQPHDTSDAALDEAEIKLDIVRRQYRLVELD